MIPPTIRKRLTVTTCSSNCEPIISRTQPGRLHPDVGLPPTYIPTHGPKQELQNGTNPKFTGTYESAAKELGEKKTVLLTRTAALRARCQSHSRLFHLTRHDLSEPGGRRALRSKEAPPLPALLCPGQGSRAHFQRANSKKLLVGYGTTKFLQASPKWLRHARPLHDPPPSLIHRVRHP
jgi:hypothetical protein